MGQRGSKNKTIDKSQAQKTSRDLQSSLLNASEVQKIQRKVQLQLYLHFERKLPKSEFHYNKKSQFVNKKASKQQIVNQTINYLKYFQENTKQLPPQHYQQLLFLLECFNNDNRMITNQYHLDSYYKYIDSTDTAKFQFGICGIHYNLDLKRFFSFNNWNHIVKLSFSCCFWTSDQWRILINHAGNFENLKKLDLYFNKITEIKEGDIERFKSLQKVRLGQNPLSKQSKEILKNIYMRIQFDS